MNPIALIYMVDIFRGRVISCQHGAFSRVAVIVASFVPAECPKGVGMWGIWKALEKGFSEMYGLGGGLDPYFFKNWPLPLTGWVFLPVLVRFQTDCTAPLSPLLQHMGI